MPTARRGFAYDADVAKRTSAFWKPMTEDDQIALTCKSDVHFDGVRLNEAMMEALSQKESEMVRKDCFVATALASHVYSPCIQVARSLG